MAWACMCAADVPAVLVVLVDVSIRHSSRSWMAGAGRRLWSVLTSTCPCLTLLQVYAFGVILWELYTGGAPYRGEVKSQHAEIVVHTCTYRQTHHAYQSKQRHTECVMLWGSSTRVGRPTQVSGRWVPTPPC